MLRPIALVPAALLASAAFWTGGFASAAGFPGGPAGEAALLAVALLAARELPDPLRLGGRAALWAPALLVAVGASWAASPVPRAGRTALVLLPAFLLLPGAVARAWGDPERRRIGVAAWGLAVAAIGAAGLVDAFDGGGFRAAAPVGHHNLLGALLAILLPVASVGLRERGLPRAIAAVALLAGGGALAATRSLGALISLALVGLGVGLRRKLPGGARELVLGAALLALGLVIPRLEAVARGADPSWNSRRAYAEAARVGARERPALGWGPGAAPWTLAGFLRPRPGANPAGELVGEPHSTPLRIVYEVGSAGGLAVLGLLGAFALARRREGATAPDPALRLAGLAGAAAGLLAALSGSWLAVPALPVALALAAGAALAGGAAPAARRPAPGRLAVAAYGALAAALLAPAALARGDYQRAMRARDPAARAAALSAAAARDPELPLYRARRAWSGGGGGAAEAAQAAREALGVAPLWLRAGHLALGSDSPGLARPLLERAMALDPLSGGAPFALFVASGGRDVDCAARALLAEPVLAAAAAWRGREPARRAAIERVRVWPGIDSEWRKALAAQAGGAAPGPPGGDADLVYRIDGTPAVAASLHLFRRPAWPEELMRIRVDRAAARRVRVAPASSLASSDRDAFPPHRCAP